MFFAEFFFRKNDIKKLQRALKLQNKIVCYLYNDLNVGATDVLCVLLKRPAYPCRYADMIPRFGRPVAQLCMIFNQVVDIVDQQWGRLLNDFNKLLLRLDLLESYTEAIYRKGSTLSSVWGIIDGTIRPCARPRCDQRLIYNGHKSHCINYQSIATPNGIVANLFGLLSGRGHDNFMLAHSGVIVPPGATFI